MKRKISVTLLSIVIGLTACGGTTTTPETNLVSVRIDSRSDDFCKGEDKATWHNCQTTEVHVVTNYLATEPLSCTSTRTYSNGKIEGPYSNNCSIPEIINGITINKETVCNGTMVNGQKEGTEICTEPGGAIVSEIIFVAGEKVKEVDIAEREQEQTLLLFKAKCTDIGYKINTEGHADCVLKMIELSTNKNLSTSSTSLSQNEQKLIEMQIQHLEQQQFDRKLEGNKELLEWAKKITQ